MEDEDYNEGVMAVLRSDIPTPFLCLRDALVAPDAAAECVPSQVEPAYKKRRRRRSVVREYADYTDLSDRVAGTRDRVRCSLHSGVDAKHPDGGVAGAAGTGRGVHRVRSDTFLSAKFWIYE